MGVMKTFISAAVCAPLLCTLGRADPDLRVEVPTCAGRLSAQLEFQWLMRDPVAARTEAARDAMLALLGAVVEGRGDETAMALRIEAKLAHATLLHRATFASDGMDAVRAERLAHRNVATCTKLVAGYLDVQLDDGNPNVDPTLGKPESAIALLE